MEYFREERDARTKAATGLPSVVTCICRCGVCTEVRSDGERKNLCRCSREFRSIDDTRQTVRDCGSSESPTRPTWISLSTSI